jgi:hypothetical protein
LNFKIGGPSICRGPGRGCTPGSTFCKPHARRHTPGSVARALQVSLPGPGQGAVWVLLRLLSECAGKNGKRTSESLRTENGSQIEAGEGAKSPVAYAMVISQTKLLHEPGSMRIIPRAKEIDGVMYYSTPIIISARNLEEYFKLPLEVAAEKIGLSPTSLKWYA